MHSIKNTHNHKKEPCGKKEPCEILQKKSKKKFPKKKSKKIEERLPRFSRSPIGGGGYGLYRSVMVVTYLYGHIDKQTDGIDRHGDRHKDREAQR